jgi:hypothetical protein
MKTNARALASSLNREIVDDRADRLTIYTHRIHLMQENLPYRPVAGTRLPSDKHFAVFADQIVLDGVVQNPGRNIELTAREIIIEKPTTLDAAGAYAAKDFAPGKLPIQMDVKPGADGTDGADAAAGGNAGTIVINAQRVVNKTTGAQALSVTELGALGARIFAGHSSKIDKVIKLAPFEIGRTKMFGERNVTITLTEARIEGLGQLSLTSANFDGSGDQVGLRFDLPALSITGQTNMGGNDRISSGSFGCKIDAAAAMNGDGTMGAMTTDLSFISDAPIGFQIPFAEATLTADRLKVIREQIGGHVRGVVEAVAKAVAGELPKATLTLLAGGGRGGRGQDGHPGIRGETGPDGAKTKKSGALVNGHYGFPEEAIGKPGGRGGQAGSPGLSGNGGKGGAVVLNVVDPVSLGVIYGIAAGEGGAQASPGERGPGGAGGKGQVCTMYDSQSGRPLEDRRAPDGTEGGLGFVAKRSGSKGTAGAAGTPLQFNGKAFSGDVPKLTLADLAQSLSLSQLLITQNATDLDFLNAKDETGLTAVAEGYTWLIDINEPFTRTGIDSKRVSLLEQKVRAGIHNAAIVSLMRLQQGLDYYGNSYNWAPVLNLTSLASRTSEVILLGKVIEDQYNRYLDTEKSNKQRMQAFQDAKQEIDLKLRDFLAEIERLKPQIDNFKTEVDTYSKDLTRQRTVLVEGELKFKAELIEYLRKESELGLNDFLDLLGTVVKCAGGVGSAVDGIKTAINAVKKAEEFAKQVKGVVEVFKKAKAGIENLSKAYSAVKEFTDAGNPNAAKILVDAGEFDEMLKEYLDKIDSAGELRKALDYYLELVQARNMAAYNYTALVAQLLSVQAQHDHLSRSIQHVNAEIAAHQDNMLPIYTAFLKDAYEDVQRHLLRNIYQENRAYQYWSLSDRPLQTDNLNVATLAATHQGLLGDIDGFRERKEAFSDFTQSLTISRDDYPNEFAALLKTRTLAFSLDIRRVKGFENMCYIVARSFRLNLPDIRDDKNILSLNLIHSGQAVLNSDVDRDRPGAIHAFSHRPRTRPYKIDYKDRRNTAGGNLGEADQGYIGLSPFTQWRLDFGLKGNDWLDLKTIKSIELTFEGRMLGPDRALLYAAR